MFIIGSHNSIIGFSKNLLIDSTQFEYFPNTNKYNTSDIPNILGTSHYSNLGSGIAPPKI